MIQREDRGSVGLLRIDHGKVGAIDLELLATLEQRLDEVEASTAVTAVVLTGSGTCFSAGLDLRRILDGGEPYVRELLAAFRRGIARLFTFPRPVVAALNGHAIAGGCVLACCADQRMMADGEGAIGFPRLRARLSYPVLALEIVRFAAPGADLEDLVFRGATHRPARALELGLVDEVVAPELLIARACESAERLAGVGPAEFAAAKAERRGPVLEVAAHQTLQDEAVDRAWADPELRAALLAHLEDRAGQR
jgi:enoyl-CoA hydratase